MSQIKVFILFLKEMTLKVRILQCLMVGGMKKMRFLSILNLELFYFGCQT